MVDAPPFATEDDMISDSPERTTTGENAQTLRLILTDQLSRSISALDGIDARADLVLMVESPDDAGHIPHHRQKLVLMLSAMRHFASSLRSEGIRVEYMPLDDPQTPTSFPEALDRIVARDPVTQVIATEPQSWQPAEQLHAWRPQRSDLSIEIREDGRFLCSRERFSRWMDGRSTPRLEHFYHHMRRETGWLMEDGHPEGGRWNYDVQNRKRLPSESSVPARVAFRPDKVTLEVIALIRRRFPTRFGELAPASFAWAVTREQAFLALQEFVDQRLPSFGTYQDAMRAGNPFLFHSLLSPYINLGLLTPTEVCEAALTTYRDDQAPLNAVEGFLRQILGWREYVRGIYQLSMPAYARTNFLDATRPLPTFYWTGDTDLACLREAIQSTTQNAYAHHIQRLMVTGNFALLAGLSPADVEEWYLAVYADAYEWVELPNTHGMALFADGGMLASKPYAASGAYIHRMSDFCRSCVYDPKAKLGVNACPFNYLYWNFLIAHRTQLQHNPRMALPYRTLDRMSSPYVHAVTDEAEAFLRRLPTDP